MNKEDITIGTFIRWKADRHFKSFDVYGKVTEVNDDTFKVLTYGGEALREEISIVPKHVVIMYLEDRKINLIAAKSKFELEAKRKLIKFSEDIVELEALIGK